MVVAVIIIYGKAYSVAVVRIYTALLGASPVQIKQFYISQTTDPRHRTSLAMLAICGSSRPSGRVNLMSAATEPPSMYGITIQRYLPACRIANG